MSLIHRRMGKLIPTLLAVIGSAALAVGVFVAVNSVTRTPADHRGINMPFGGAVYVGEDTCFTCHRDENPDWSLTLDLQQAVAPMANPQVVTAGVNASEIVPHLDIGGLAALPTEGDAQQQYIIETEDDQSSLPGLSLLTVLYPHPANRLRRFVRQAVVV